MGFTAPRRRVRLDVLIPSSFSKDTPHPRDRMLRLGMLARALAAARAEALLIYHEDPERPDSRNAEEIRLVMEYLNTAPYLRRRLYPLTKALRYAGVLPPLNIPTHPEKPAADEEHWREGLVTSSNEASTIEAGLGKPVKVSKRLRKGSRVLLHVKPGKRGPRVRAVSRRKAEVYPGFRAAVVAEPLAEAVKPYDLRIATSRKGEDVREALPRLREALQAAKKVCVAFGAAKQGLYEIAEKQGARLEETFHLILNTFPRQGVKTIRTEEAVHYTLAILNLLLD